MLSVANPEFIRDREASMSLQSEQVSRCFAALNMTRCVWDEKEYTKFVSQRTIEGFRWFRRGLGGLGGFRWFRRGLGGLEGV